MYELSRLRGVSWAMLIVLAALAGLSALANTTLAGRPSWLARGDSTIEGGQERVVAARIAGAIAAAHDRPGNDRLGLGVLLGSSAVGMGIDPARLEAGAGDRLPRRWLSLYANGANLADLRDLFDYLSADALRVRLLVLGIHPGLLARSDNYLNDRRTFNLDALRAEVAQSHVFGARDELQDLAAVPLNWAFPNRTRLSNDLRSRVARLKRQTALRWGWEADHLYAANRDFGTVRLLIPDEPASVREAAAEGRTANVRDQAEGPIRQGRFGAVNDKGWNDPTAYSATGDNAAALVEIIRRARSRQIEVALLILPESSGLRASTPSKAMQTLRTVLADAFPTDPPPVINLLAALRDDQFHDSIHPNQAGREVATRRLIEELGSLRHP